MNDHFIGHNPLMGTTQAGNKTNYQNLFHPNSRCKKAYFSKTLFYLEIQYFLQNPENL